MASNFGIGWRNLSSQESSRHQFEKLTIRVNGHIVVVRTFHVLLRLFEAQYILIITFFTPSKHASFFFMYKPEKIKIKKNEKRGDIKQNLQCFIFRRICRLKLQKSDK